MRRVLLAAPLALTMACSTGPRSGISLLVANTSCQNGACQAVRVLAFPVNQPGTPGGPWSIDLGVIATPSACLTFPADVQEGSLRWNNAMGVSLGGQPSGSNLMTAYSTTPSFVPTSSVSWITVLPGGTSVSPTGTPCSP